MGKKTKNALADLASTLGSGGRGGEREKTEVILPSDARAVPARESLYENKNRMHMPRGCTGERDYLVMFIYYAVHHSTPHRVRPKTRFLFSYRDSLAGTVAGTERALSGHCAGTERAPS